MPSGKLIKNILGLSISAALVIWLYYSIEWQVVWSQLHNIRYLALIPLLLVLVFHFYLRALRWRYLLPKTQEEPSIGILFDCIMMGNFATFILPLRAGEFIRPYLLTHFSSHNFLASFSSVVVERFFDLSVVLFTFAYVVTQVDGLPDWSKHGASLLGIMAVGILIFIIVGSLFPRLAMTVASKLTFFLPAGIRNKILKFLEDFLSSAQVLSSPSRLILITLLSLAVWAACFVMTYAGLLMLPGEYSFLMAVTATVVIALAVAAPSAPGFIGVYQTACIASFKIFGLSSELAVTYSIITHLLNYILFALCALIFCFRRDFKFSKALSIRK